MEATRRAHAAQFAALDMQRVALDGILLKPNMVVAGQGCATQPSPDEVADAIKYARDADYPQAEEAFDDVFTDRLPVPDHLTA